VTTRFAMKGIEMMHREYCEERQGVMLNKSITP
jgi:hypothetical protein